VLIAFENNEVDLPGTSSSHFFELLREMTIEGVYADPLYGGNRNMEGWRMKEYPGVQMTYAQEVETEEFLEIEPSSLHNTHHTRYKGTLFKMYIRKESMIHYGTNTA